LKFLVDSAVSPQVAAGLRRSGHDAVHVVDYGLGSSTDEIILVRAAAEGRVLITSDTDFGELLAESGASRPSIILFRRTSGKPSEENALLARALAKPEIGESLEQGGIIVVDSRRIRIRKLPLGSSDE
jgi:predicted nuclease of predicted toxin-antitoxin system